MLVLVVNAGSSSLKYQLINMQDEHTLAKGIIERIGKKDASLTHETASGLESRDKVLASDHSTAMKLAFEALGSAEGMIDLSDIGAIGHRVVHGGERFSESVLITREVIGVIEELSSLAPLHNPPNLMGIKAAMDIVPGVPHVAVFDTAFHQTMPKYAYVYALPYEFYSEIGIRRYGFHGTSHRYVAERASVILERRGVLLACQKVVTCHLGNGVSLAAVCGGRSVDTSMGMTPVEGLVMGTRSGDLDPAIIPFLERLRGWSVDQIEELLNKKSGLLGISGLSNDMRDIEKAAGKGCERSKLAFDIFCYRVRKYIGAYAAAMGGLSAIVFTAGIGEHSSLTREHICRGLEFLGVRLDSARNAACDGECDIATDDATVRVLVIPTNEELEIARETVRVVRGQDTKDEARPI